MLRAGLKAIDKIEGWVIANLSRKKKLVGATHELGHRAATTQAGNNDAEIGVRLDAGKRYKKEDGKEYQRFEMQFNKQASDSTLREAAKKDPHKTYAEAEIEVGADPERAATYATFFDTLREDFKARADK